ncbi:hypothetical protein BHM03_00044866 [Ensete ventricosum]|nr:hypothetical protein BHM03_00044866 [Ensete ventricosum]
MALDRCCLFLEILISIAMPPLGVFLHNGCCSVQIPITISGLCSLFTLLIIVHLMSMLFVCFFDPKLEFCICLLLTVLGYVPGIIYAIYVLVAVDPEPYRRGYYQPLA